MELLKSREINKQIIESINKYKVVYISGSLTLGTQVLVQGIEELINKKFYWYNVTEKDNENPELMLKIKEVIKVEENNNDEKIIVLENLGNIYDTTVRYELAKSIKETSNQIKFIIITKNPLTKEYKDLYAEDKLICIDEETLRLSEKEIRKYCIENKIIDNPAIIKDIFNISGGSPILTNILSKYVCREKRLDDNIVNRAYNDFFDYIDIKLFTNVEKSLIEFMCIAYQLGDVNVADMEFLTNDNTSKEKLKKLNLLGILSEIGNDRYKFKNKITKYIIHKTKAIFSEEKIREIQINIAKMFFKKNQMLKSAEYYVKGFEFEKAAKILEIEVESHMGIVNNNSILKKILFLIPEKILVKYPYLCANIAIIYSLKFELEKFEYWKNKLIEMKNDKSNSKIRNLQIDESISYCKISSPGISAFELIYELKKLNKLCDEGGKIRQDMTLTGNQPTLISGSKDICDLGKKYELSSSILSPVVEKIFGEKAAGASQLAIGEVLYQKNELDKAIIKITEGIVKAEKANMIDLVFVGYNLLTKIKYAKTNEVEYVEELKKVGKELEDNKVGYLKGNYIANNIRYEIVSRNIEVVRKWSKEAVDVRIEFNTLNRFQYLTKVRAYILLEEYDDANITLDMLYGYIKTYKRTFYEMEYYILKSIIMNKLNQYGYMNEYIEKAILLAQKYGYVRIFADEGSEVYQVFEKYEPNMSKMIKKAFFNNIKEEVNKFSIIHNKKREVITNAEMKILKLMEDGYSNDDIANKLYISKSTVKTHINHIYSKLQVKNRVQAINKIKEIKK